MKPLIKKGFVSPGMPQILLSPDAHFGYQKLNAAYKRVQKEIEVLKPDVLILYSTFWPSVIGHQIYADPQAQWVHVDQDFHDLGSIDYQLKMDPSLGEEIVKQGRRRQLTLRSVNYRGFPVDTGSLVTLKLFDPDNKFASVILSSNVYADRAETIVFGKSVSHALQNQNKTAVVIAVTLLSNRMFSSVVLPQNDKIHSLKDQEWNIKILEFLKEGRLEDVAQLSRQVHREARVNKVNNFKAFWWLSAIMGQNNFYCGEIYEYQAVYGTGSALIGLTPSQEAARDLEFDENDPEIFSGERNVLGVNSRD